MWFGAPALETGKVLVIFVVLLFLDVLFIRQGIIWFFLVIAVEIPKVVRTMEFLIHLFTHERLALQVFILLDLNGD